MVPLLLAADGAGVWADRLELASASASGNTTRMIGIELVWKLGSGMLDGNYDQLARHAQGLQWPQRLAYRIAPGGLFVPPYSRVPVFILALNLNIKDIS